MIRRMQAALVKKDIRNITVNKRLFPVLLIVPLVMVVVLPTVFLLSMVFAPAEGDSIQMLIGLLPQELQQGDTQSLAVGIIMNDILPLFFLLIPIMAASVMAASSFVGEKEKSTLETLLYSPLTLRQIFTAKVLASFGLSMLVSFLSFAVMLLVVELELWFLLGGLVLPGISWLVLLLLVSPAVSLVAITLIVRGSAKAQTVEESQQRSVFLILPIILLAVGQISGLMLIHAWMLLVIGVGVLLLAVFLMRTSVRTFQYETLLQ